MIIDLDYLGSIRGCITDMPRVLDGIDKIIEGYQNRLNRVTGERVRLADSDVTAKKDMERLSHLNHEIDVITTSIGKLNYLCDILTSPEEKGGEVE